MLNNAEHIEERLRKLQSLVTQLTFNEDPSSFIRNNREFIETITPYDIFEVEGRIIKSGVPLEKIKAAVGKVVNVIHAGLSRYSWERPAEYTFLYWMIKENESMAGFMDRFRPLIKELTVNSAPDSNYTQTTLEQMKDLSNQLHHFDRHFQKKELILFPALEKFWTNHSPLQVMWSIDDDCRACWKTLNRILNSEQQDLKTLQKTVGQLFFLMLGMKMKEELVLFPRVMETLEKCELDNLLRQSTDIGWCFLDQKDMEQVRTHFYLGGENEQNTGNPLNGLIELITGKLSHNQLISILNGLPVDITFVDENDEVQYFSSPDHRIFPRTKGIIGRNVKNCHPPESLAMVEALLEQFKDGRKNEESFWINFKGQFIVIYYKAIRDSNGSYMGTLEVSMDATSVRSLTGEKRLLD